MLLKFYSTIKSYAHDGIYPLSDDRYGIVLSMGVWPKIVSGDKVWYTRLAIMSALKYLFSFIHWKSRLNSSQGVRIVALEQRIFLYLVLKPSITYYSVKLGACWLISKRRRCWPSACTKKRDRESGMIYDDGENNGYVRKKAIGRLLARYSNKIFNSIFFLVFKRRRNNWKVWWKSFFVLCFKYFIYVFGYTSQYKVLFRYLHWLSRSFW